MNPLSKILQINPSNKSYWPSLVILLVQRISTRKWDTIFATQLSLSLSSVQRINVQQVDRLEIEIQVTVYTISQRTAAENRSLTQIHSDNSKIDRRFVRTIKDFKPWRSGREPASWVADPASSLLGSAILALTTLDPELARFAIHLAQDHPRSVVVNEPVALCIVHLNVDWHGLRELTHYRTTRKGVLS